VAKFIEELEKKDIPGFEFSEEAFYRYQRQNDHELMLKAAINLMRTMHPKGKYFIELSAKCAIEKRETDFAWKTALFAGNLKKD
jgi:hypothetical protein